MYEPDKSLLNWDIPLNFDNREITKSADPVPPKIPPRQIIGKKFPKILDRIDLLWCSLELHSYLEHVLFTERLNRHGFPDDVLKALGEIYAEHMQLLKQKKMISVDIWDV